MTPEEETRAAQLEAAILAEEQAAAETRRGRERGRRLAASDPVGGVSYTSVPLGVRAAEEYGYVKRDIRRIAIVGGLLLGILAILQVVVNVNQVIQP